MSCAPGKPCEEGRKRRIAIIALVLMAAVFATLSIFSFLGSRNQVLPNTVKYADFNAVQGKRVFQSYNCMGCHTIVGNGAYFAPDLTKLYDKVGPAWLAAFLPSAGGWPTGAALRTQLQNPMLAHESGATTLEEYFKLYPGAAERVERRGGHATLMPNLPLKADEIGHLTAFLKYTSAMNNEGWPPVPKINGLATAYATPMPTTTKVVASTGVAALSTATAPAAEDPATTGKKVANEYGCMACHATDQKRLVGPGWGGLHGSKVTLADGKIIVADDAYLTESIRKPDAAVVAGFPAGVMPSYEKLLQPAELDAIVSYIGSLKGAK